ncbi:hypothetical protein HPB47_027036 [Ixodes persulcatus]|uniref:Uncharacterized protein n=1 Tax=Ixodes persulcatus TaxID=34615 RepID=A0AC60PX27_IXOPE|nr:hypothetical protein HPB47_027036 [Ixodes persulcatus]
MERLKQKRKIQLSQVTKALSEIDAAVKREVLAEEELRILLARLNTIHGQLNETDAAIEPLLTYGEAEQEYARTIEYNDRFVAYSARLSFKITIASADGARTSDRTRRSGNESFGSSAKVKLPELELLRFNGDSLQWQSFWEQFEQVVHNNRELSPTDKFNYLRAALSEDVAEAIAGLPATARCYEDARDILKTRFGDEKRLIDDHMIRLLERQRIRSSLDVRGLRRLHGDLQGNIRGLRSLGSQLEEKCQLLESVQHALDSKCTQMKETTRELAARKAAAEAQIAGLLQQLQHKEQDLSTLREQLNKAVQKADAEITSLYLSFGGSAQTSSRLQTELMDLRSSLDTMKAGKNSVDKKLKEVGGGRQKAQDERKQLKLSLSTVTADLKSSQAAMAKLRDACTFMKVQLCVAEAEKAELSELLTNSLQCREDVKQEKEALEAKSDSLSKTVKELECKLCEAQYTGHQKEKKTIDELSRLRKIPRSFNKCKIEAYRDSTLASSRQVAPSNKFITEAYVDPASVQVLRSSEVKSAGSQQGSRSLGELCPRVSLSVAQLARRSHLRSEDNGGPRAPAAGLRRGPPRRVAGKTDVLDAASPPVGPQGDPLAVGPMWTRRTLRTAPWHPPLLDIDGHVAPVELRARSSSGSQRLLGRVGIALTKKVLQVRVPGMRGAFVSWRIFMEEIEDARLTLS